MPWVLKLDKGDFVGRFAAELVQEGGLRERLVGFTMPPRTLPAEGAQVVVDGRSAGRVTSARVSERLGRTIGLAWVGPEVAHDEAEIAIRVDGRDHEQLEAALTPDPAGTRPRVVVAEVEAK